MTPPAPPPHVLVIDDDQAIVRVYTELFEEEGYRVTTWQFPEQDVEAIKQVEPDVVLVDLFFGESDAGWRYVEFLRARPETAELPVVVASASSRLRGAEREQLAAWDCRVVIKPFDIDVVIAAVEDAISGVSLGR
jgi:CheY-like chemotaxis protein